MTGPFKTYRNSYLAKILDEGAGLGAPASD
jgi:hypothetical protein